MGKKERSQPEPESSKAPADASPDRAGPAGGPTPADEPSPPPLEEWRLSDREKLAQGAAVRKRDREAPAPPDPYRRVSWIGLERAGGELAELDPRSVPWNPLEPHALVGLVREAELHGRTALLLDPPYLPAVERELLRVALKRTEGKAAPAARLLGLSRETLVRRRRAAGAKAGAPRGMGGRPRPARAAGGAPLDYDPGTVGQALLLVSLAPPWLAETERKIIALALQRSGGKYGAAAAFLGVTRGTLLRRLVRDATPERRAADRERATEPARAELLKLLGSKSERIRLQAARNLLGAAAPPPKPKA
jgi:DNA-binding protein Fis